MLLPRSNGSQRGYTVAELLSVVFVLALITTAVALIIGPLLRSQAQTQAKVDTVQAADMALYRIERDLRNTDSGLVYTCTTGSTPSCAVPATTLTATSAIVMPSAYKSGTGQFQLLAASGSPNWQGATVYWIDSNGNIDVAFDLPPGYTKGTTLRASDAANAVADVTASGGMQLARFVQQLSLAVPGVGNQIDFQLKAQSTVNGALNETTYSTHVETRN
jgi:type II secretory pathway pseudopilin PulG